METRLKNKPEKKVNFSIESESSEESADSDASFQEEAKDYHVDYETLVGVSTKKIKLW